MQPNNNQVSESGLAFTAAKEGCALSPYPDTANLAVGIGLNKPGLKLGDDVTYPQAIAEYLEASREYDRNVNVIFAGIPLLQHQHDALFSVALNVGATALGADTDLIEAIRAYRLAPTSTPDEIVASKKLRDQAGHLFDFIGQHPDGSFHNLSRRKQEATLFMSGNYGDIRFMPFWPRGTSPRATPPDPFYLVKMPTFRAAA